MPQTVDTDIVNFVGTEQERKRAIYVLVFLQTCDRKLAARESGLSTKCHNRIVAMFRDRGHIFEHERSGRPATYTEAMMEQAFDMLINYDEGYLTGTDLWRKLKEADVLHQESSIDPFMKCFHAYVKHKGLKLITNSMKTIFLLTKDDVRDRYSYAAQLLPRMTSAQLEMVIFVDETTMEECPHPKGKLCT